MFLPEIMDFEHLPHSLHVTIREVLGLTLDKPFRLYNQKVIEQIMIHVESLKINKVMELGAGSAPISERLAKEIGASSKLVISPSDRFPDVQRWKNLESDYPGMIQPIYETVDFLNLKYQNQNTLYVLSSCFHHIRPEHRNEVLKSMIDKNVLICESINRNLISLSMVLFGFIPALLAPIYLFGKKGKLRRFFWCWLVPVVPIAIVWDGIASCFRCWTKREWQANLEKINKTKRLSIESDQVSTYVFWS